ncbi:uncharacterized protein CLUP02_07845 [Colletotrichum lupini]|uniref:Uncharacterized protein n=1 Tax=Colletotrichum lupini TaxID=145971 RepID=A0A9Q8WGW3_9PEZI|nr:uncharacterized protein CLUP02_07845 [Colletotrichum lupini]UQC82357.1 hypothetical protein CLUP02_07845 [Colletotrichum lupini]
MFAGYAAVLAVLATTVVARTCPAGLMKCTYVGPEAQCYVEFPPCPTQVLAVPPSRPLRAFPSVKPLAPILLKIIFNYCKATGTLKNQKEGENATVPRRHLRVPCSYRTNVDLGYTHIVCYAPAKPFRDRMTIYIVSIFVHILTSQKPN